MLQRTIITFCCVFFTGAILFAAHPLATDDIGVVDICKYELELGYDNCGGEDTLKNHSCGVSLKHGLTEKMDIGVSFPYQVKPKLAEPLGTTTLGFKFALIKDIFSFTINNELGLREYSINCIVTREINPITVHLNVGYVASGDENVSGEIGYSSAVEYSLAKIDLVGEVIAEKIGLQNYLLGARYKTGEVSKISF